MVANDQTLHYSLSLIYTVRTQKKKNFDHGGGQNTDP